MTIQHILTSSTKMFTSPDAAKWRAWQGWSPCTVSCGGGKQSRLRSCTSPVDRTDNRKCKGKDTEEIICNVQTFRGICSHMVQ